MSFKSLLFPTKDLCFLCKDKTPFLTAFVCPECLERLEFVYRQVNIDSKYVTRTVYALSYNRFLRELIHDFKFNGKSYMYKPFAEILINTIKKLDIHGVDLIMYVPIHYRKEAIRGYNQSELLARYISQKLNIPISKGNLIKKKWTKEQNTLDRVQRLNNLRDSFNVKNPDEIKNKRILLIDDLITTGSTFNECSKLLIENGSKEVIAMALTSSRII
jgi:ComF family protein